MAEFLGEHFVAAYEQMGTFEVVNLHGELQKNGGNVASYFLTPSGRVIHAVAGQVNAERLLEEVRWAVRMSDKTPGQLAQAHQQAAGRQNGNRAKVHRLLAANPLPVVEEVSHDVFIGILNEKPIGDSNALQQAQESLRRSRQEGKPLLLILHRDAEKRGRSASRRRWIKFQAAVKRSSNGCKRCRTRYERRRRHYRRKKNVRLPPASEARLRCKHCKPTRSYSPADLLKSFERIALPLRELPILSEHLEATVEPYRVRGDAASYLIVADSGGNQVGSIMSWRRKQGLRALLRGALAQAAINDESARKLRKFLLLASSAGGDLADRTLDLIAEAHERRRDQRSPENLLKERIRLKRKLIEVRRRRGQATGRFEKELADLESRLVEMRGEQVAAAD